MNNSKPDSAVSDSTHSEDTAKPPLLRHAGWREQLWHHVVKFFGSPEQAKTILLTLLCSIVAALGAVAFMTGTNVLFAAIFKQARKLEPWPFLGWTFVAITISSLIVGWLLSRFCREAAGSGVPQVKVAFWQQFGFLSWRSVWVKFIAGVISIGGGSSLGREGPSVFVGAGLASWMAGLMGLQRRQRRAALITGVAASLAAAFNTPLAAIAFALEEIIHDFSSRLLGRIMLGAVLGALIVHAILGAQPAFELPRNITEPRWIIYFAVVAVAVLAAVVAGMFQNGILGLRQARLLSRVPAWLRPWLGGMVTWVLGATVFLTLGKLGVFGLGYDDLNSALTEGIALKAAFALLACKLVASIACYGFGGCGGIFSPLLFLGAMTGFTVAGVIGIWAPLDKNAQILLASVGMCSCFGAAVRAPWSALLIVFEMTHVFAVIPALMLGTLLSQGVIRLFARENFYDAILMQDGHRIHVVAPPRTLNDWQAAAVMTIANPRPVMLTELSKSSLQDMLKKHPYHLFPVRESLHGFAVATRDEIQEAVTEDRAPRLDRIAIARPDQTVREAVDLFVHSDHGMILVVDDTGANPVGLLTLHDLLRAQTAHQE